MKILITGGVGFIGTNICCEAIRRGYEVIAFDNLGRKGVENNLAYLQTTYKDKFQFVKGDVRQIKDFEKVGGVNAIIHLAANPSVIASIARPMWNYETNTTGTVSALQFAIKQGKIPFLYASTNKVYSDITNKIPMIEKEMRYEWLDTKAIDERYPIDGFGKYGHSLYGVSKLAGELFCQEYHIQFGLPMVIFRMSCIYGLFQKGVEEQAWVDWFLRQIVFGDGRINIFGNGKQVRDVLDGRDTAKAYLDALENLDKCDGEIFTLGGGLENTYSLLEAIKVIEDISGKKARLKFFEKRPADQDVYISDISKVKDRLAWEPKIKFEQAIKNMIKQYEKT